MEAIIQKIPAVEAAKPVTGSYPQVSVAILRYAEDNIVGQPVGRSILMDGEGLCPANTATVCQ